jgi:hypothetical protein
MPFQDRQSSGIAWRRLSTKKDPENSCLREAEAEEV